MLRCVTVFSAESNNNGVTAQQFELKLNFGTVWQRQLIQTSKKKRRIRLSSFMQTRHRCLQTANKM